MSVIKQNQNEEITRAKKKAAEMAEEVKSSSDDDQEAVRAKAQPCFTPKNGSNSSEEEVGENNDV
jgi:hypothetical protein